MCWMSTRQKPLPWPCGCFDIQQYWLGLPRIAQGLDRLDSSSLWVSTWRPSRPSTWMAVANAVLWAILPPDPKVSAMVIQSPSWPPPSGAGCGRCYLATSVMLGVAAEREFLVIAESYAASSMAGAPAMARELAKARNNYFALWTEFRKRIEPIRQDLPDTLADAFTLDAIADLIRLTRNEAGHPTGRKIDEDTARVHLTSAPMYLRKMQLLSAHFARMPGGEPA
jgi:hypothetical protein